MEGTNGIHTIRASDVLERNTPSRVSFFARLPAGPAVLGAPALSDETDADTLVSVMLHGGTAI